MFDEIPRRKKENEEVIDYRESMKKGVGGWGEVEERFEESEESRCRTVDENEALLEGRVYLLVAIE